MALAALTYIHRLPTLLAAFFVSTTAEAWALVAAKS